MIDWDHLKPRILRDLEKGKTQREIRGGLAEDPDATFRVSISKSQLETKLNHWKYRRSLHEPEWKVISHRIHKRRKAGKPTSQVLVNGFVFSERQVAKAISRYDIPTLAPRLPSPQIPPELSHHRIEVRTPPSRHRSLHFSKGSVAIKTQQGFALHLELVGCVWPQSARWRRAELLVGEFVARFFIPAYEQDERSREAFNTINREFIESQTHRNQNAPVPLVDHKNSLQDKAWNNSLEFCDGFPAHRDKILRSSGGSNSHAAIIQTLLNLLYGLSNQSLDDVGLETLASMMDAPAWDTVLPHLRDVLTAIDSNISEAIAEGLFKEAIRTSHSRMLDLALGLGADPTQLVRCFDFEEDRHINFTPLVAICNRYSRNALRQPWKRCTDELIISFLKRDPCVSNSTLLWIIRASFHAIAEQIIRSQPERVTNFCIAVSDLEEGSCVGYDIHDPVTPLLVACSDPRQSAEKLSLIRCLLERNGEANLETMIAAAAAGDGEVVSLLHQHGAPVNGFIPKFGSPLSNACRAILHSPLDNHVESTALPLLLRLEVSPNDLENRDLNRWEMSPLHIVALAHERPMVTTVLNLLIEYGTDVNHCASFHKVISFRGRRVNITPGQYGQLATTALEYAIQSSHWMSALRLLSANCQLTGREMLFINGTMNHSTSLLPSEMGRGRFRQFIDALLAKAPEQAAALHWSGLTVLQKAIENEHQDMIMALFSFGVTPTPSDFLRMLCNRTISRSRLCQLSSGVQMNLVLAARPSEPPITDAWTVRRILAVACPELVRYILNGCPEFYDSEGLCYVISRIVSEDKISYYDTDWETGEEQYQKADVLNMEDLHVYIGRRTLSNRHEDWESTAVTIAARAGRVDILQIITGSFREGLRRNGLIPLFLLKQAVKSHAWPTSKSIDERNSGSLGVWIKYCRMDDPLMRCSPLTAAAMVVPRTTAVEVVDLLLAMNYQPDGWTVLIASCEGHLSILQRLKRLENWPHILGHRDRPDWCPTALQTAVYNSHPDTVSFLLDTGDIVDTIDLCPCRPFSFAVPDGVIPDGYTTTLPRTALQHAVERRNVNLVTLLVDAGADVNAPAAMDSGATALQIACIQGSTPMVQYLIRLGADLHAAGAAKHGRTALQGAAEHGRKDIAELLLDHDESTAHTHREQLMKAVFYAEKNAQHVVARIIRERLLPRWSSEDDETLEMLKEDLESSSESSLLWELAQEIQDWQNTFDNLSESSHEYESESISDVWSEEADVESLAAREEDDSMLPHRESPAARQDDEPWFFREMEWEVEGEGGLGVHQENEIDLNIGDFATDFTLQEDNMAWVELLQTFEGYDADDMLLDTFF